MWIILKFVSKAQDNKSEIDKPSFKPIYKSEISTRSHSSAGLSANRNLNILFMNWGSVMHVSVQSGMKLHSSSIGCMLLPLDGAGDIKVFKLFIYTILELYKHKKNYYNKLFSSRCRLF